MKTQQQIKIENYLMDNQRKFNDRYIHERRLKALIRLSFLEGGWKMYDVGEKPHALAGETRIMQNGRIRVFLCYGHGRYNYAPAIEIES